MPVLSENKLARKLTTAQEKEGRKGERQGWFWYL